MLKAIKEMWRNKAAGYDNILADLFMELGENGMKIMTLQDNKIFMSGDWPKDCLEVTTIALPKKHQAKKFSDNRTISLISHTGKLYPK